MVRKHQHKPNTTAGRAEAAPADVSGSEAEALAEEVARLEAEDGAVPAPDDAAPPRGGAALVEPDVEAIHRLEREVQDWKDRAMRGAADFDNYRRRAIRERDEAAVRGQSEIVARVIDVVDDLARVAALDPATTAPQALHDGMMAIERKMMKMLESAGIERIDPLGQPFDPKSHEAVTTAPAPGPEADDTVAAVFQTGYRFKGNLLRPARVAVNQWSGTT